MSPSRRLCVLPSVTISVRERGTPALLRQAISACIRALPRILLGSRYAPGDVLVDTPGDLECDVAIAGEQVG